MPIAAQQTEPTVEPPRSQRREVVASSPSSHSDSELTHAPESNPALFQAIGTIYSTPERDETGKFFVRLDGQRYGLFIPRHRYIGWLKQIEQNQDQNLYLRVYPKCLIIPQQPQQIYFELIFWADENRWEEMAGHFTFRGVWQFVPQLKTPVISVYRNRNAIDPSEKFKAAHLPVLMRRDDGVNPFRFNPKIPSDQLPKRWFIQALFKFIPLRNCWGWVEDLEEPTEQIPRYQKPVKAIGGAESVKADLKKSSQRSQPTTQQANPTQQKPQLTQLETQSLPPDLIMIPGRTPEITVKFTTRPDLPAQGKKVILQVTGENGVVVLAELNRKTLQKQMEKMDSYADWVAVLSGRIARVTLEGVVELESAGITVFEKKQKLAPGEGTGSQTSEQEAGAT
jgi:hypothetical protein